MGRKLDWIGAGEGGGGVAVRLVPRRAAGERMLPPSAWSCCRPPGVATTVRPEVLLAAWSDARVKGGRRARSPPATDPGLRWRRRRRRRMRRCRDAIETARGRWERTLLLLWQPRLLMGWVQTKRQPNQNKVCQHFSIS
jgi:hypothetical protein